MLNPYLLRKELPIVEKKLLKKGFQLDVLSISRMENERKILQVETENLQHQHKLLSDLFKKSKILKESNENLKNKIIQSIKNLNILKNKLNILKKKFIIFLFLYLIYHLKMFRKELNRIIIK